MRIVFIVLAVFWFLICIIDVLTKTPGAQLHLAIGILFGIWSDVIEIRENMK